MSHKIIIKTTPRYINLFLLIDIFNFIKDNNIFSALFKKRSGFSHDDYIIYYAAIQILKLSPTNAANILEQVCEEENISFQKYNKSHFTNGKKRRRFPDQPSLPRYIKRLIEKSDIEIFWNYILLLHLLYLARGVIISKGITLIADYTGGPCIKDKNKPYCFGRKEGKTDYRTLTFSVIGTDLDQIIAIYKIKNMN